MLCLGPFGPDPPRS